MCRQSTQSPYKGFSAADVAQNLSGSKVQSRLVLVDSGRRLRHECTHWMAIVAMHDTHGMRRMDDLRAETSIETSFRRVWS